MPAMNDPELKGYVDALHEQLSELDSKFDQALGHIAVLNDEHNNSVAWRHAVDEWRSGVDVWKASVGKKLTIAAYVGTGAAVISGAASIIKLFHG